MNICRRVHTLLLAEELSRPEIRERLAITPDQLEAALCRLVVTGDIGYNGVLRHRTYFAKTTQPLPERRGIKPKSRRNLELSPTRVNCDDKYRRHHPPAQPHPLDVAYGHGFPIARGD